MLNSRFWEDGYISELDPTEKLLFIYFITNPRISLSGIYEVPLKNIALDTGIDKEMIEKILTRFSKDKKIVYMGGWLCVINYPKYQNYDSPTIKIAVSNELNIIPAEILDNSILYGYPIDRVSIGAKVQVKGKVKERVQVKGINVSPENRKLAQLLYDLIKESNPAWHVNPNWDQWAEDIRKLRELDKRTEQQIEFIIRWSQSDDFWKRNILSPGKLRKQFNTLVVQAKAKSQPKVML